MPLYEIKCSKCGDESTIFRPVVLRNDLPSCICEGQWERLISAPAVKVDIPPFRSPIDGKWVNSRKQQTEDLKRSNCILQEPGVEQDIARRKIENADKAFKPLENAIDATVQSLVATGTLQS